MSLSVDQALRKAKRHADKGEAGLAAQQYKNVLEKYPKNQRAIKGLKALQQPKTVKSATDASPSQQRMNELIELYNQGKLQEALVQGEALAQQFPNVPLLPNLLGAVNAGLGRLERAVSSFTKALQINPDYAEAHYNLGNALRDLGKLEEAVSSFTKALQINPNYAQAHNNLGNALKYLGKLEEAVTSYNKALQINPDFAEAHRNLSTAKKYHDGDPQTRQMLQLVERHSLSDEERMHLNFALGKAHGDIGNHDRAFSCLLDANRLRKEQLNYDISPARESFAKILSTFSKNVPILKVVSESASTKDQQSIFILGMPRSGTTLVEQILASHSQVYGAGELELLGQSVNAIEWSSTQLSSGQLQSIRKSYLSRLMKIGASEPYVTDKMPLNFWWIGFLVAAIPESKIVHVKRDARATCWSNFKQFFSRKGIGFAYDLQDIAEYYKMYIDLMAFWHEKFPGRIYDLNYEALTEHQEVETRKLLEYVGLNWEDQCLEFHKTKRAVQTASDTQVRQKMYQGSSDEWRKYEKHLEPMVELLSGF